jgi:hypothetical protein
MKRENSFAKALMLGTLLALAVVTAVSLKTQHASASAPHAYPPTFGMIGITQGQTARLNVVNTADIFNPRGYAPAASRVTLKFLDGAGRVLVESSEILEPGQATQLDFNADRLSPRGASRLQIRAVVSTDPDIYGFVPCVMPNVEVYDTETGKDVLIYPATLRRFTNLPDPYAAP